MTASLARHAGRSDESDVLGALHSSIDRFMSRAVDPARIDRTHEIDAGAIDGLASLGLFGLSIPEAFGGAELSMQSVCSTVARLARYDRSIATTIGLHAGLGTRGLIKFGSDELKTRYLPSLAAGRTIAAFATTEAGAGSDLSAIATTAEPSGDGIRVDGAKVFVTNGGRASLFTLTTSSPQLSDARRGHSLVVLERSDAGVSVGAEEDKLGLRGCSTTSLYLDDVRVSRDRLLGEPGAGMRHLAPILAYGRTVMAAGCVGAAHSALAMSREQVKTRVQFGRPIGTFAVVRRQIADMATLEYAAESLVRWACASEDDDAALLSRSLAAKVFASDAAWRIADLNVQLHGGSGFIEETAAPRLLRDARIPSIFEGANDVLLVHAGTIAAQLGHPEGEADGVVGEVARYINSVRKELGIRLLRRQRELHRLGMLSVIAEVTKATDTRAALEASGRSTALAGRWNTLARRMVADELSGDDAFIDDVVDGLEDLS